MVEVDNDGNPETSYEPGELANSTTYEWKVITNPDGENITFGPYEFTTIDTPPSLSGAIYDSHGPAMVYDSKGPSWIYVP